MREARGTWHRAMWRGFRARQGALSESNARRAKRRTGRQVHRCRLGPVTAQRRAVPGRGRAHRPRAAGWAGGDRRRNEATNPRRRDAWRGMAGD
nr:hypothetical protein DO63_5465 [Burkholderia pseudomallei]